MFRRSSISAGLPLRIGTRKVTVDIAFGGEFYAIADSEAIGIPIDMANAAALVRMGREIKDAVESTLHVSTRLTQAEGHSRHDLHGSVACGVPICEAPRSSTDEVLRRSPGVTGTAALLAVLDAMGLLTDGSRDSHTKACSGRRFTESVRERHQMGDAADDHPGD